MRFLKWLCGLIFPDMQLVITNAMQEQKRIDDKEKSDALNRLDELNQQALNLQRQIYEAKITMLESNLADWKKKEKTLDEQEYKSNMQIAINYEIAGKMIKEARAISGSVGKFQGIYDEAKIHHDKKIKEIGV